MLFRILSFIFLCSELSYAMELETVVDVNSPQVSQIKELNRKYYSEGDKELRKYGFVTQNEKNGYRSRSLNCCVDGKGFLLDVDHYRILNCSGQPIRFCATDTKGKIQELDKKSCLVIPIIKNK